MTSPGPRALAVPEWAALRHPPARRQDGFSDTGTLASPKVRRERDDLFPISGGCCLPDPGLGRLCSGTACWVPVIETTVTRIAPDPARSRAGTGSSVTGGVKAAQGELAMGFEPIRLLVVDDHAFVRAALVDLFAGTDDIVVVGECVDGAEVPPAVEATHPDVVLMDVDMPRVDGVKATRALLEIQPAARVLMLTGTISAACIREVHSLGAKGYLLKGDDPSELIERVREVATGGTAWGSSAAKYLSA